MSLSAESMEILSSLKSLDLTSQDPENTEKIKYIFKQILESGNSYKMDSLEAWIRTNLVQDSVIVDKILNFAHYQKAKYDAKNPLKMAPDNCGCGGDC